MYVLSCLFFEGSNPTYDNGETIKSKSRSIAELESCGEGISLHNQWIRGTLNSLHILVIHPDHSMNE